MKAYRVLINGRNFRIRSGDDIEYLGFFTTRFVRANSVNEAELLAVDLIKADTWLQKSTLNSKDDPPMLFADEIDEVEGIPEDSDSGFCFYSAKEDEESE